MKISNAKCFFILLMGTCNRKGARGPGTSQAQAQNTCIA